MKLSRIKWSGHPILGDFELNLRNQAGVVCDTIVIAGENGTGKTTILTAINDFMEGYPMDHIEFIEYVVGNDVIKAVPPQKMPTSNYGFYDIVLQNGEKIKVESGKNREGNSYISRKENDPRIIRQYGCIFSKARADYKTNKIDSVKNMELDTDKHSGDTNDDFTSLKQLLVDVQNQDNEKYTEINRDRGNKGEQPMSYGDFEPASKIFRFKNAFNNFFERVKYNKVSNAGKEKVVLFSKNGKDISIDKLSTGEKQIVYRGAYLLKNLKQLEDGIIMIDEPELSMHPKWQEKILKYYRDLFPKNWRQGAQMIFATHSPGVIREAMENSDDTKVIVLKCDDKGVVSSGDMETPLVLKGETSAEINYQAFNIASTDYHNALYGYIEAEGWKDDFDKVHPKIKYIKPNKDGTTKIMDVTLSEKIRHIIHHPENELNTYSDDDIKASIGVMREFIKGRRNIGVCQSGAVTD